MSLKSDYEVKLPRPHEHQREIIDSLAKRKIIKAGRTRWNGDRFNYPPCTQKQFPGLDIKGEKIAKFEAITIKWESTKKEIEKIEQKKRA